MVVVESLFASPSKQKHLAAAALISKSDCSEVP